jgi:hypothetical protein
MPDFPAQAAFHPYRSAIVAAIDSIARNLRIDATEASW